MSGEGEVNVFDESVMDGYWLGRMEHDEPPGPSSFAPAPVPDDAVGKG